MELEAIRKYMQDHPGWMTIRMADGSTYDIPHRDWISFGPPQKTITGKEVIRGTSFLIFERAGEGMSAMKLQNASLVVELSPILKHGRGQAGPRGRRKKTG